MTAWITYAAFEHFMMWFWAGWLLVLIGFGIWAAWALLIDEPRIRRRVQARLASVIKRPHA